MKTIIDKAASRGYFDHGWLKTHHTFSFADYYNPKRMHFGALRVLNDDWVTPGNGFDTHPHKNMEVVSIPLRGRLRHGDSVENVQTIVPGEIQVMSTGRGIYHSEYNGSDKDPVEFLKYGYSLRKKVHLRSIIIMIYDLYLKRMNWRFLFRLMGRQKPRFYKMLGFLWVLLMQEEL